MRFRVVHFGNLIVGQAELWIAGTTIYPAIPFTNDDIYVDFVIQNLSGVHTTGFYVDVYVDRQPAGCSDWGDYWVWMSGGLPRMLQKPGGWKSQSGTCLLAHTISILLWIVAVAFLID